MTSSKFALSVAVIVTILGVWFSAFNFWQDDFGLFWSNGPKRIWDQERSSKYLMSFRYIPRNFQGLLIGPSYSDRLNTKNLRGYRVYNLSLDGANATELKATSLNVIERGKLTFIVLCLDPYITRNFGLKGNQINSKEYWGSLFSLLPLKLVRAKLAIHSHPADDWWADSTWGYENRIGKISKWDDFVRAEYADTVEKDVSIDPGAYRDVGDIVSSARQHGVRVFAFFFPLNVWLIHTAKESGEWDRYRAKMTALFDLKNDVVWDMTVREYDSFRADPACYTDGHTSAAGARLILLDIERQLNAQLRGIASEPVFPRAESFACLGKPGAGSGYDHSPTG